MHRRWLEIDLRVGGAYRLLGPDGETRISGTVLELVPEGELVLSWLEEGGDWCIPLDWSSPSLRRRRARA